MARQASNDNVPLEVARYLLPQERNVITIRKHPVVFARSGGLLASSAITAGLLTATRRKDVSAVRSAWGACGAMLVASAILVPAWLKTYCVVTNSRLMFVKSFPRTRVATVQLREIHGIELRRSWLGRLLGYGTFVIKSSNLDKKIRYLPYPDQLYLEMCGALNPANDESS